MPRTTEGLLSKRKGMADRCGNSMTLVIAPRSVGVVTAVTRLGTHQWHPVQVLAAHLLFQADARTQLGECNQRASGNDTTASGVGFDRCNQPGELLQLMQEVTPLVTPPSRGACVASSVQTMFVWWTAVGMLPAWDACPRCPCCSTVGATLPAGAVHPAHRGVA